MNSRSMRNVFVYLLILVALVLVVVMVFRPANASTEKPISEVIAAAQAGTAKQFDLTICDANVESFVFVRRF